jgi:hypothetical protein
VHFIDRSFPLNDHDRRALETSLDTDLSLVRIHTGSAADALTRSFHADALTRGSDIYFRDGAYHPSTFDG